MSFPEVWLVHIHCEEGINHLEFRREENFVELQSEVEMIFYLYLILYLKYLQDIQDGQYSI